MLRLTKHSAADDFVSRLASTPPLWINDGATRCCLCSAQSPNITPESHDEECLYRIACERVEFLRAMWELAHPESRKNILGMLRAALYCIDPSAAADELRLFFDLEYPGVVVVRVPEAKHIIPLRAAMLPRLPFLPTWDFVGPPEAK